MKYFSDSVTTPRRILGLFFFLCLSTAHNFALAEVKSRFITLGTNSGPIPDANRAQPSNVLVYGDQVILIDAGDGASWQLAKAGISLGKVNTVLLSHLHFDHTGGLFAFVSQRLQSKFPGTVTIYGPEGTKQTVEALISALKPAGEQVPEDVAKFQVNPSELFQVVELNDKSKLKIGEISIKTSKNSHYILAEQENDHRVLTLAYRFDLPDRSIVYTGDTGPSEDVIALAAGADFLVTKLMDADETLTDMQSVAKEANFSFVQRSMMKLASSLMKGHFEKQHLSPEEAGKMASRAKVKALVITHNAIADKNLPTAEKRIRTYYQGSLTMARDLDEF